jgi:dCMP deaminase
MKDDKDVKFMRAAYRYAEANSTDPSTQNGAVLVWFDKDTCPDGCILASGSNHFPHGVKEIPERWQRPLKYKIVIHAEAAAIYDAAQNGVRTKGLTMYAPWIACGNCAGAIIQAGIIEVIGHKPSPESMAHIEMPNGTWDESIAIGMTMLEEAGVSVRYIEGKLDPTNSFSIRRNGQIFHP